MSDVLKVFMSSTAVDMMEHRKEVSDALSKLDNLPVKMEAFGAKPTSPVDVCKEKVIESGALVVMLAHRYGWVPTVEEGGDGIKSITWIEVETALENNIPVFAFLVNEDYGWAEVKEQDTLVKTKDPIKIAETLKKVQSLNDFKDFLNNEAGLTRDTFTTPEKLALNVTTAMAGFVSSSTRSKPITTTKRNFIFRTVHHLQPAPYFRGRTALLKELVDWHQEPVTADRVRSLVAIGGAGKTALTERFLNTIKDKPLPGSVLVWSFYDAPDTDAFLREACILFAGKEPEGAGGKLELLQRSLMGNNHQHLIVLDGLERIQSEGKGGALHAKGDLEDHRLKNLLRAIAQGLGNTRALITTRFKVRDLEQWENTGYKSHSLEVLDKESAIAVLRAWQVNGSDNELLALAEKFGRHALSVSVLGSYIKNYCNKDPKGISDFKLEDITDDEPLAARLAKVLGGYAKSLPEPERDLLVRLSVFPKGVSVDILGFVINAGGEIAGALIDFSQHRLSIIAEKLRSQGLIYSYEMKDSIIYTAHPFLREYFRELLGVKPEEIHEVVFNELSIGLDTKPENKPIEPSVLDQYEQLIEYCILAGHYQEAYDLFYSAFGGGGGNDHLFHILGDYGRIIRISKLFSENGITDFNTDFIASNQKGYLLSVSGLAYMATGDLEFAEKSFKSSREHYHHGKSMLDTEMMYSNIAEIYILKGLLFQANELIEKTINSFESETDIANDGHKKYFVASLMSYWGVALHFLGSSKLATEKFKEAKNYISHINDDGVYTNLLLSLGNKSEAVEILEADLESSDDSPRSFNLSLIVLGNALVSQDISKSRNCLNEVRAWTEQSGHMECILQAHILAGEIACYSGDYPSAIAEAELGFNQAESRGYGRLSIDLLLLLAKIYIAIPDYKKALGYARQALDRSADKECGYAWGMANGGHLCGVCHKELRETELARKRLTAALELREKIQHPEADETRKLLDELPKKK